MMNTDKTFGEMNGAFIDSLKRNNAKIRSDRAIAIAEDAEMIYKREVEDLQVEIKKLLRERENALDLSPTTTDSLILATDFKSKEFVQRDLKMAFDIRNLTIKYELAVERYQYLFNKTF